MTGGHDHDTIDRLDLGGGAPQATEPRADQARASEPRGAAAWTTRLARAAVRPVNSASVAVFRIAFGVAMVVNVALYLPILVYQYYVDTTFHFTYGPFTFVRPLPGPGVHLAFVVLGVLGVLVALGKWYRPAITALFVITTYIFLLDSTFFQNHEYLISLLSFLMIFLPLDRRWSLDARRHPERSSSTVPAWVLWLLRFQIGVPYFFGGIAKLNRDWLQGEPLRAWLAARTDIEPINTVLTTESVVWFMAYGALVLDLLIVGFLLWRRTRVAAFTVVTCFHLMNVWLFGLFIFPWLMIAATTLFFEPDWPERVLDRVRSRWAAQTGSADTGSAGTGPAHGESPGQETAPTATPPDQAARRLHPLAAWLLIAWVVIQITLPMRHLLIPGDPNWTEQGHRFAWHMKLRDKQGSVTFQVTTAAGTFAVDPRDHLGDKQVYRLPGHPERLVLFARHLSELHDGAEVRAETNLSLNGRAPQPFVDPEVDLARVPRWRWGHADWILPLEQPLRR